MLYVQTKFRDVVARRRRLPTRNVGQFTITGKSCGENEWNEMRRKK